mmetsp:Transcript_6293/g.12517  ORF Transcript_6293/g.12517 Transcript_6293/m.12517 type:complete len:164 (-) Transcript_6293:298-789(-)
MFPLFATDIAMTTSEITKPYANERHSRWINCAHGQFSRGGGPSLSLQERSSIAKLIDLRALFFLYLFFHFFFFFSASEPSQYSHDWSRPDSDWCLVVVIRFVGHSFASGIICVNVEFEFPFIFDGSRSVTIQNEPQATPAFGTGRTTENADGVNQARRRNFRQ